MQQQNHSFNRYNSYYNYGWGGYYNSWNSYYDPFWCPPSYYNYNNNFIVLNGEHYNNNFRGVVRGKRSSRNSAYNSSTRNGRVAGNNNGRSTNGRIAGDNNSEIVCGIFESC